MEKVKCNRCKYCTKVIEDGDLITVQQLDMRNNPKFAKDARGNIKKDKLDNPIPVTFNAHIKCHENKTKEKDDYVLLYNYLLKEYFGKMIPTNISVRIADLRNGTNRRMNIIKSKEGYDFKVIYDCFVKNEKEIQSAMVGKTFNGDVQRGNYIMAIVENRISEFNETKETPKIKEEKLSYKIQELRALPYSEYLLTEHWIETREKAKIKSNYRCEVCNSQNQLNVHHKTYENRGCELPEDLIVLCQDCHKTFHHKLA